MIFKMDFFQFSDFFLDLILKYLLQVSLKFLDQSHDWMSKFRYLLGFITFVVVTLVIVQMTLNRDEFGLEISVGADDWKAYCVDKDVVVGAVFFDIDLNIICIDLGHINCDHIVLNCRFVISRLLLSRRCFGHVLVNLSNIKWPVPRRVKHLIVTSSSVYHTLHFFQQAFLKAQVQIVVLKGDVNDKHVSPRRIITVSGWKMLDLLQHFLLYCLCVINALLVHEAEADQRILQLGIACLLGCASVIVVSKDLTFLSARCSWIEIEISGIPILIAQKCYWYIRLEILETLCWPLIGFYSFEFLLDSCQHTLFIFDCVLILVLVIGKIIFYHLSIQLENVIFFHRCRFVIIRLHLVYGCWLLLFAHGHVFPNDEFGNFISLEQFFGINSCTWICTLLTLILTHCFIYLDSLILFKITFNNFFKK